jgi:amino acid permease
MIIDNSQRFSLKKSAVQITIFAVILFAIHKLTIHNFFGEIDFYFDTWKIYGFHFVTVLAVIYIL